MASQKCLDPDPLPSGYPSSAILDCFHYYGKETGTDRFHNNHAAHTDSGTLTLVVCSDEPGLEVYDEKEKCWVSVEKLVHQLAGIKKTKHTEFGCLFWGDSVESLEKSINLKLGKPCLHRVAACGGNPRLSVVFKQRSAPLKTFCRYQEDYVLAFVQLEVLKESKEPLFHHTGNVKNYIRLELVALALSAIVLMGTVYYRQKLLW